MGELKFARRDNKKYGTISITIRNGVLPLKENFEIIANEKTDRNYRKATVRLTQRQCDTIEKWEEEINKYLKTQGVGPVKFLYGNRIYPRTHHTEKSSKHGLKIRPSGVWVSYENKPFLQYWLE